MKKKYNNITKCIHYKTFKNWENRSIELGYITSENKRILIILLTKEGMTFTAETYKNIKEMEFTYHATLKNTKGETVYCIDQTKKEDNFNTKSIEENETIKNSLTL